MAHSHYFPLTISDADITGTPGAGFVAPFAVTHNDLRSIANGGLVAQADGDDIALYLSDGTTQIPYDRVFYDPATGDLHGWVRITCATGLVIRIYVGDSGLSDQQDRAGCWSGRVAMLSLDESAAGGAPQYTDRTGGGFHGTVAGGVTTVTGKLRNAAQFNGTTGLISTPTSAGLRTVGSVRLAYWAHVFNFGGSDSNLHFQRDDDGGNWGWVIQMNSASIRLLAVIDNVGTVPVFGGNMTEDTWHYIVAEFDRAAQELRLYVDGVEDAGSPAATGDNDMRAEATNAFYTFAAHKESGTPTRFMDGMLDEIVLEHGVRSADWTATEYAAQNDVAGFWTLGAAQSASGVALDQFGYRFYADDDVEGENTPLEAENTPATLERGVPFRLRVGVDATGDPDAKSMQLEYRRVGDTTWRKVE